jgi:predicted amidohydrolase
MSEPPTIRVAGVQMEPKLGDVKHNLGQILARLATAAGEGARLVVFPECALTGYGFRSRDEARVHAEPADGPAAQAVSAACRAHGVSAVYGFLESDGDRLFNACVLVGPEGLVATYRKVHLPFLGVDKHVDPGDRPFAVHEAAGLKIGMHICYDGAFPEPARVLSLLGAELIVLPTNWPTHSECAAEHMIATRAMENVVYAMAVNRVGEESGFRFIGRSSIAATNGQILAKAGIDGEEILYADIDPARARQKRLIRVPGEHEVDRIGDRRPAFYAAIVEPNGRD